MGDFTVQLNDSGPFYLVEQDMHLSPRHMDDFVLSQSDQIVEVYSEEECRVRAYKNLVRTDEVIHQGKAISLELYRIVYDVSTTQAYEGRKPYCRGVEDGQVSLSAQVHTTSYDIPVLQQSRRQTTCLGDTIVNEPHVLADLEQVCPGGKTDWDRIVCGAQHYGLPFEARVDVLDLDHGVMQLNRTIPLYDSSCWDGAK